MRGAIPLSEFAGTQPPPPINWGRWIAVGILVCVFGGGLLGAVISTYRIMREEHPRSPRLLILVWVIAGLFRL
jgi:hypothetical protein